MNAEERREARRRRILENSEMRLKKITNLSSNQSILNEQSELKHEKPDSSTRNSELLDCPVPKFFIEDEISIVPDDQQVFNYEPYNLNQQLHSKNIVYEIKFSSITILHILLSQIVLVLFYYDLGFLFGNSIIVPFLLSAIPEIYRSKEQHNNFLMMVLLMLGLSRDLASRISRYLKLASVTGKRFCVYIFCFICSYAILTSLRFEVKHNSFKT